VIALLCKHLHAPLYTLSSVSERTLKARWWPALDNGKKLAAAYVVWRLSAGVDALCQPCAWLNA